MADFFNRVGRFLPVAKGRKRPKAVIIYEIGGYSAPSLFSATVISSKAAGMMRRNGCGLSDEECYERVYQLCST